MSVSRHFIFLEFTNPAVRSLLTDLRNTLYGAIQRDPVHVTVCGPYKEQPSVQSLESKANALHGEFVNLRDIGKFKTTKGYIVYINAYSRIFQDIWWKPDFKKKGRIPHLTLFETTDLGKAKAVILFLESEKIEIVTHNLDLTVYTSKQSALWPDYHTTLDDKPKGTLERINITFETIERARLFMNNLNNPELKEPYQFNLI